MGELAWESEVVEQDGKEGLYGNVNKREIPFKRNKNPFYYERV